MEKRSCWPFAYYLIQISPSVNFHLGFRQFIQKYGILYTVELLYIRLFPNKKLIWIDYLVEYKR